MESVCEWMCLPRFKSIWWIALGLILIARFILINSNPSTHIYLVEMRIIYTTRNVEVPAGGKVDCVSHCLVCEGSCSSACLYSLVLLNGKVEEIRPRRGKRKEDIVVVSEIGNGGNGSQSAENDEAVSEACLRSLFTGEYFALEASYHHI